MIKFRYFKYSRRSGTCRASNFEMLGSAKRWHWVSSSLEVHRPRGRLRSVQDLPDDKVWYDTIQINKKHLLMILNYKYITTLFEYIELGWIRMDYNELQRNTTSNTYIVNRCWQALLVSIDGCQMAQALQLGLPVGQRALLSSGLLGGVHPR